MFLDNKADVTCKKILEQFPVFDGYHYFDGMYSMIDKISRQAAFTMQANAGKRKRLYE